MKNTKMKSTHMFRDQVDVVSSWFSRWNECEQTVALYSLLRKVSGVQAKFLLQVIQQSLTSSPDVIPLERQANDPAYISSLCAESKAEAVACLLSCLPLLQAGNVEAKEQYLKIIPKILAHSLEKGCHIEESRQLLSYTLIHPAISADERTQLKLWQRYLEECYAPVVPHQQWASDANDTAPSYVNNNGHQRVPPVSNGISMFSSPPVQPATVGCNSLHQMSLASSDSGVLLQDPDTRAALVGSMASTGAWTNVVGSEGMKTNENNFANGVLLGHHKHLPLHATYSGPPALTPPASGMCNNVHRKLTRSVSDAHAINSSPAHIVSEWLKTQTDTRPLSPQSSVTSSGSGSDTHPEECGLHDRNTFLEEGSGMREVPIWLKSLRLHKYASLFQQLTYDDMMSLTEDWLDSQGVTKGARHKIVLNIARLKERQNVLRAMEKDIMEGSNIKQALSEIKAMLLNTPIRSYTGRPGADHTPGELTNQNTTSSDDTKSHGNNMDHAPVSQTPTLSEGDSIPEGDVPGQLTRVMGKLCTQLLVTARPEDNCFAMYLQLLDKCLLHEAFTNEQKKKLLSWRQQTQKLLHTVPQRCVMDRQRVSFNSPLAMSHLARTHRPLRGQKHLIMPPQQPSTGHPQIWAFGGSIHSVMGGVTATTAPGLYPPTTSQQQDYSGVPYPFELPVKQLVGRTQSAPNKSSPLTVAYQTRPVSDLTVTEPDINARLDSLCLSMTEHALGSFDGPDRGSTF